MSRFLCEVFSFFFRGTVVDLFLMKCNQNWRKEEVEGEINLSREASFRNDVSATTVKERFSPPKSTTTIDVKLTFK